MQDGKVMLVKRTSTGYYKTGALVCNTIAKPVRGLVLFLNFCSHHSSNHELQWKGQTISKYVVVESMKTQEKGKFLMQNNCSICVKDPGNNYKTSNPDIPTDICHYTGNQHSQTKIGIRHHKCMSSSKCKHEMIELSDRTIDVTDSKFNNCKIQELQRTDSRMLNKAIFLRWWYTIGLRKILLS